MSKLSKLTVIQLVVFISISLVPVNVFAQSDEEDFVEENSEVTWETSESSSLSLETNELIEQENTYEVNNAEEEEQMNSEMESVQSSKQEVSVLVDTNQLTSAVYNDFSAKYFANILKSSGGFTEDIISAILLEESSKITLKVNKDQENVLTLLSQTTQGNVMLDDVQGIFNYSNWEINFVDQTGVINFTEGFAGLGDLNYPFCGTISGQTAAIVINNTLFKALDANAQLGDGARTIQWKGTSDKAILADVLLVDESSPVINLPLSASTSFSPYIGKLQAKEGVGTPGEISLPSLNYKDATKNGTFTDGAGLLCGTMAAKTKLKFDSTLTLTDETVNISASGDTGALVGKMESDSILTVSSSISLYSTLVGNDVGGLVGSMAQSSQLVISSPITMTNVLNGKTNAGGLVGSMALGSSIQLNANVSFVKKASSDAVINNSINSDESAGGIVGTVATVDGPFNFFGESKILLSDTGSRVIGGTNAGGFYGKFVASGSFNPFNGIEIAENNIPNFTVGTTIVSDYPMKTITVGGNGNCGGIFGYLNLNGNGNKCEINNQSFYVKLYSASNTSVVGGVTGVLEGKRINALVMSFSTNSDGSPSTKPNIIVDTKPNGTVLKPKYLGGLVGFQNATLDVSNIFTGFPYASQTYNNADKYDYFTGGLSGYVCDNMLLKTNNTRIVFSGYTNDDHNGGIAGYTGKGSIVYLMSNVLLRDCPLQSVSGCGQLVAKQDCSLILGKDVSFTRWGQGMEVDDIGNYGELYCIDGLLNVNEDYTTKFLHTLSPVEGVYVFKSELDYACYALAWQSRGVFATVSDINTTNWSNLRTGTIKLENNINLTGKGIGGLSRDIYTADDVFEGTFIGNDKTLTLDIGAKKAQSNAGSGDGRIYFHNSTGLFAALSSKATISNLTIDGSIRVSNNRLVVEKNNQSLNMKTGALAGLFLCEDDDISLDNISTAVKINAESGTQMPNAPFYIGGLFGLSYGSGNTVLTISGDISPSITHKISESNDVPIIGQCFHTGGAIGAIDAGCNNIIVKCDETVISGMIERTNSVAENFYAGGLIGTIFPSENSTRVIKLTNIKIGLKAEGESSAKTFVISGGAELRMGGVLGGIWADTNVVITNLGVEKATIDAKDQAKIGGLVYRASGKWDVYGANLKGLSVKAPGAKALGLMVCQGGAYKEPLIYDGKNTGDNTYKEIGGLYLVVDGNWNTDYTVPSNENIVFNADGEAFDEFVAYTASAYFTEATKNSPAYSIFSNSSGIISLKTENSNVYINRTDVSKKMNPYSRYYYNLPEIKKGIIDSENNRIDTASELLIWSVYHYAASNLRNYFAFSNVETFDIGGTAESRANFDMNGLSYYPLRIVNSSINVHYADIKFYNKDIEEKVPAEKKTRGNYSEHSQHYTMHCGLFFDFAAENIQRSDNYTMTVNSVEFAGTVGKVNGQSGALICGSVYGGKENSNTAICTVVLADSDDSNKAITLNGVTVDSTDEYRPVLIGHMDSYTGLRANYIVTSNNKSIAGSSLIGTVGSANAVGISIAFAGTIKLPDTKDAVFTSATLLQSLQYQSGSTATYRFNKDKDWDGGEHKKDITYGLEISESKEFEDDKGCYYDGFGEQYYISDHGDFSILNDFNAYLPYVAYSPAKGADLDQGWHELEVNILASDLKNGCGTYGHPYHVNAKDLRYVAIYLSNPSEAPKNWTINYKSQEAYHKEGADIELTFSGTNWTDSDGKIYTLEEIQNYLNNAYYVIEKDITLRNFPGLGTVDKPFAGVITGGNKNSNVKVTLSGTTPALVYYSYGSVVRNIDISLEQKLSLLSSAPGVDNSKNRKADVAPDNFFGGVIGRVMGGDNIVDNVSVTMNGFSYTFADSNASYQHLVPIGAYVGVIAGGGVLFRGNISSGLINDETSENSNYLYRNPIIGRVLGGYAFYEGSGTAPDNTNKNYKINAITSENKHLSWNDGTVTMKDSEGLLLLSAIISSGAGSYGDSLAYKTGYGVARSARFNQIGEESAVASSDYSLSLNTSTPYLLSSNFNDGTVSKFCKNDDQSGITIVLDNNINISDYGNGYRGLSARYVSNAGFTNVTTMSPYTVVLRLKCFDGNNKTISGITSDVKEYDDDDFHIASMGGVFNIAWTNKDTGGGSSNSKNTTSKYDSVLAKNLTLTDCTVKLQYIDKNGNNMPQAQTEYFSKTDGISTVAVGGFIGSINNLSISSIDSKISNYLFDDICVNTSIGDRNIIYGPNSAGGLIGATGMTTTGYPGKLTTNGGTIRFAPSFLNCSISNVDITGFLAAGGMVGCSASSGYDFTSFGTTQSGTSGLYATCTITDENLIFANNSTITTKASGGICAGVFGGIGMRGLINDDGVNNLTGLKVIDENESIKMLHFQDVSILAEVAFSDYIYFSADSANGLENGKVIAAAGCVARISNPNDISVNHVKFSASDINNKRCLIETKKSVANTKDVINQYSGGLIAYGYTTEDVIIDDCHICDTDINSLTSGGLIAVSGFDNMKISNSSVDNCKVNTTATQAGGLVGLFNYKNCNANLINILIKNTSVTSNKTTVDSSNTGRLFGKRTASYTVNVSAAGISVYSDSDILLPNANAACEYVGYIAYGDYLAINTIPENVADSDKYPYVTVNPNHNLPGTNVRLTGDAIKASGSYKSVAEQIFNENNKAERSNYATYSAVDFNKITEPNVTSLYAALGEGPEDLPVLLVKGGDAKAITDYLDIITNGGYSAASKDTVNKVSFSTTVYYLSEDKKTFSTVNWDNDHTGEPSVTTADNDKKLVVSGTSYDNTRHRFTLVEATFQTALGNYVVSIPVVVQRKLEYVYMATLSYGMEFYDDAYNSIDNHLLESTDVPFSAYLTISYNQSFSNNKIETAEYDWKSYIESGGNLIGMDKSLTFVGGLPKGTQFTLVDCKHNNQAFYYCDNNNETVSLALSSFRNKDDVSFVFSMADVLGISVQEDTDNNGNFVVPSDIDEATIVINGEYFRPIRDGEKYDKTYNLIYPENISTSVANENYYLVVTVPKQDDGFVKNGLLQINLTNYGIPTNGKKIRRDKTEDNESNTESTYNISSGYKQELSTSAVRNPINLNDVNNKMHIELADTISFSRGQAYTDKDSLYIKFTASLLQTKGTKTQDRGIPAGTAGTVMFYIQDTAGSYYVPNGDDWDCLDPSSAQSDCYAGSYDWVSDGGSLSLTLSRDGNLPLDLSGVRKKIYDKSGVEPKIIVRAVMKEDITPLSSSEDDVIPSSKDGTDNYARLHYVSQLSTQARSLDYSTLRAVLDDQTHYYRYSSYQAILAMDAGNIDQLGINPLQLVDDYRGSIGDRNISFIDLNVSLDLSNLQDIDNILENTASITFILSLQRRSFQNYSDLDETENISDFIAFRWNNDTDNSGLYMTINKDSNNGWKSKFDNNRLSFPIKAFVFTDQDSYANYQIKLDVSFNDINGNSTLNDDMINCQEANVIYTYACIKPSFYFPK